MRVCVVFVMEDQTLTAGHVDTTRRSAVRGAGLLAVGLLLAALGACREEEQGRELHFHFRALSVRGAGSPSRMVEK
jgi:hypothetical protein